MAYSRKAPKQDIRSVQIKSSDKAPKETKEASTATKRATSSVTLIQHDPSQELRRILLITIPLFILLGAATYWDLTHHWVVPFADRLLKLAKKKQAKPSNVVQLKDYQRRDDEGPAIDLVQVLKKSLSGRK